MNTGLLRKSASKGAFTLLAAGCAGFLFGPPASAQVNPVNSEVVVQEFEFWFYADDDLDIGAYVDDAEGRLIVPGAANVEVLFGSLNIGYFPASTSGYLEINGPGARVVAQHSDPVASAVRVGFDGTGEILVTDGGYLFSHQAWVGYNEGSSGKITLTGEDSMWEGSNYSIRIGHGSEGTLHVLDGATLEGHANLFIGNISDTTPEGEILSAGSGELLIEGGSTVVGQGHVRFANQEGTTANGVVRGEGTLLEAGAYFDVGFRGNGELLVEDGAQITTGTYFRSGGRHPTSTGVGTITGPGTRVNVGSWVHVGTGGNGTFNVLNGAQLRSGLISDTNAGISVPAGTSAGEENARGAVTVSGPGSLMETTTWMIVGRGNGDDAEVGTEGTLVVEDGGLIETGSYFSSASSPFTKADITVQSGGVIRTGSYFRIGSSENGEASAVVTGAGSAVEPGSYIQIGFRGDGSLLISEGGRVEIPLDGGSISSTGRHDTSVGDLTIEGEASLLSVPRFLIGSDTDLEPSGFATVRIRDGGALTVGGHLVVRNGSLVELDGGTITMEGGIVDSRADEVDIANPGSMITGTGVINSDVVLSDGGALIGTGETGITLNGSMTGDGQVENITFGDFTVLSSSEVPAITSSRFAPGGTLSIVVDASTAGLINADAATDFSNANVVITFEPFEPGIEATFQLFTGDAALNFASVSVPSGWELGGDGVLQHTGAEPGDTAFEQWTSGFALSGADAAPGANPTGDGFSNTQKFAFGIDPTVAVASLTEVEGDAGAVTLRWNQLDGEDVTYVIERRSNLTDGEWAAVEGTEPVTIGGAPDGYTRYEWTTAIDADGDQAFYRARAVVDASLLP